MESNTINFIKEHFGCYKYNGNSRVLNSIATMSIVSLEDLHTLHENVEEYFTIKPTENGKGVVLVINDNVRQYLEEELGLGN